MSLSSFFSRFRKSKAPEISIAPSVTASFSVVEVENEFATNQSVKDSPQTGHSKDNLNYYHYAGEALFLQTNRMRKVSADAFDIESAVDEIVSQGYDRDSVSISPTPFDPPTEGQIESMKKHNDYIPSNLSSIDASYLISRYMNDDPAPDPRLLDFATSRKIKLSYYIGNKNLHDKIWKSLSQDEKFAFFLCCVSNDSSGDWRFGRWSEFLDKGKGLQADTKFMKSFKEHYNLGYFNGMEGTGRYRQRACYTIAKDKL